MTSPDVSPGRFVLFAASIIGWMVWISYALKFLFGAAMSGGWLAVGVLVSLMALGLILLLKDLLSAVEEIRPQEWQSTRPRTQTAPGAKSRARSNSETPAAADHLLDTREYHVALGLQPRHASTNRRRTRPFHAARTTRPQGVLKPCSPAMADKL